MSYQGYHDLRNQVNYSTQCCKSLKTGEVVEFSEEEQTQMQDEMQLTIKQVTKRLQQLQCMELIYSNNYDVKSEVKMVDDFVQELFKKTNIFLLNKEVDVELVLEPGRQYKIYEDVNLLSDVIVQLIIKLKENGQNKYKLEQLIEEDKHDQQLNLYFEIDQFINDQNDKVKLIEQHIKKQNLQNKIKDLLINTQINLDFNKNCIIFNFPKFKSETHQINNILNFNIHNNLFETNYRKPSINKQLKGMISMNLKNLILQKSSIKEDTIDQSNKFISKFTSKYKKQKRSSQANEIKKEEENKKNKIKKSIHYRKSRTKELLKHDTFESEFDSELNMKEDDDNPKNKIKKQTDKSSTKILSSKSINTIVFDQDKDNYENEIEPELQNESKNVNNSVNYQQDNNQNNNISDKKENLISNNDINITILNQTYNTNIENRSNTNDIHPNIQNNNNKIKIKWKSSTIYEEPKPLVHICSKIINIDDEECILNMHRNLFKRKLKIDINTCKNYVELKQLCNGIQQCTQCKDKVIVLISDQMLENEQGSDVVRNIISEFDKIKFVCYGLTSSEDIQVKNDFTNAGILKLYIKPLKVKVISEIIKDSGVFNQ